jgi:hypothetical protein
MPQLKRIYLALSILQLVPIWSVRYLPTVDGASHVYNAWILRELLMHRGTLLQHYFQIDWQPHPNWIATAALALLMTIVPPIIAEKLFVSAIVLLFALAAWMYAGVIDERSRIFALLAMPFTYNWLLQSGFYNFSLGVALCFITIAVWWRRRRIIETAALLVVCYFAHPMAIGIASLAMGLIWLATSRKWRELLVFVPVAPLLIWYARLRIAFGAPPGKSPESGFFATLAGAHITWTFAAWQRIPGAILVAAIALLVVATAVRRVRHRVIPSERSESRDPLPRKGIPRLALLARDDTYVFLILTLILILIGVAAPDTAAGGLFVRERLSLFIYLAPLPYISATLIERWQRQFVAILGVVVAANIAYLAITYVKVEPTIETFVRVIERARPQSTVLAIMNANEPLGATVSTMSHAIDYAAVERGLVDVNNYEPDTGYFPIAFREGITRPRVLIDPVDTSAAGWSAHVDYVATYRLPPDDRIARDVRRYYRPSVVAGETTLSERSQKGFLEDEFVLLPIAGTTGELGAPTGIRMRVDQTMRNGGVSPVHVSVSSCALTPSCDFELPPGRSVALAAEAGKPQYIMVRTERGSAKQLEFSTIVRRTDDPSAWPAQSVPAVSESEFLRGHVVIPDVPTDAGLNLRVWFLGSRMPARFRVRALSRTGEPRGEQTYNLWPIGYATNGSLRDDFPLLHNEPATFIIEPAQQIGTDLRVWAMITTTDYVAGRATISLPSNERE